MKQLQIILLVLLGLHSWVASASEAEGVVTVLSTHSVEQTAHKLVKALQLKGLTVFATIDHAKGASSVGLTSNPSTLVIFGNPKIGSLLIQCNALAALDLPQKALIWEDNHGQVWLSYNNPVYLAKRYHLGHCASQTVSKIGKVLNKFATVATH